MFKNIKIKKNISLFIIIFILLGIFSSFALSSKSKGIVLRNFKKQQYKLLFESDKPFLDENSRKIFDYSRKYELFKGVREKVQEKREFLEKENIKITNKIGNLSDSIIIIDKEIKNIVEETLKINNQIISLKKNISTKNKTIKILKDKIRDNKNILYKYIVYIYKKGNYVFQNGEVDNLKAIFFSGEDIGSILNDLNFKGIIQVTGKRLIDKHRGYINNLYIEQLSLKKIELETKSLRKQLIIKKGIIKQKKEFKEKLLKISKGKQQIYRKFIDDKLETEKKIRNKEFLSMLAFKKNKKELLSKEGCDYIDFSKVNVDKLYLSDKCKTLNSVLYIESKLRSFNADDAGNILKWPVDPGVGISTFFHDNGYIAMFGEDHGALDIPVKQGTEVRAPADGYVVYINKPTPKGYSYLALKHSNGIITVYGHLSEVLVKEMDFVKEGDVFVKTGGTPGKAGSGPMTTGPHLHFEVWEDKKLKDPLKFLNTAYLEIKTLPPIYYDKYKNDYKAKNGKEFTGILKSRIKSKKFKITGDNEIERQRNFLNKYASLNFRDWSIWVEEGIEARLDPTFLMCVGLAETGLGRNLKTPYNVGNVGNTDSGATKNFTSSRSGIAAMTRTFNNRYLKQYNQINLLSRYGNLDSTKPIYASSPINWHNNIITCMSHIKGRYIPDSFNFRLK